MTSRLIMMANNVDPGIDLSALELSTFDVMLRLGCAMLIGMLVGTEREYTHRPAGMRTHMLVAVGACAVMLTSQMIFWQYRAYGATPDPGRLSAQVITGMGFLGAGTIMKEGANIKGLTTAASIWTTACLGIAVGGGYYNVAIAGAVCMLVTLIVFEGLQRRIMKDRYALYRFNVKCGNAGKAMELVGSLSSQYDAGISMVQVTDTEGGYILHFRADFGGRRSDSRVHDFFQDLSDSDCADAVSMERSRM